MHDDRFDAATRLLAHVSRRRVVRALVGAGAVASGVQVARAAPGRSRPAACRKPGKSCKHGGQCCSGVCQHKKCRTAPNQGTCTLKQNQCVDAYPASACNGPAGCACFVTTSGASFCGGGGICATCATDADCARIGQPGAICVRSEGDSCCGGDGATACTQPCPNPAA
ncbi:MAG TPA: hypothetical protein VFU81_07475 [Thermomicrobiales bacterium]|nr:hypothetical protein [Thermomicrobiales bacterium]